MIRLLERPDAPAWPEPLCGCVIETLLHCYGALPGALDLYETDQGGLLCRVGGRLLLSGGCDAGELRELMALTGIVRLEGRADALPDLTPDGWRKQLLPALRWAGPAGAALPCADERALPAVFALLGQVDADFYRDAEYLPWLSDITLRLRRGRACVWLTPEGGATASATAIGGGWALLASVATHPDCRGRGLASALVTSAAAALAAEGLRPFVLAAEAGLVGFYERLGFVREGQQVIFTSSQEEGHQ